MKESDRNLLTAAVEVDLELLTSAIRDGADINVMDREGYTALHLAVVWKHFETCNLLLAEGADPNIVNRHGNGPLWAAVLAAR